MWNECIWLKTANQQNSSSTCDVSYFILEFQWPNLYIALFLWKSYQIRTLFWTKYIAVGSSIVRVYRDVRVPNWPLRHRNSGFGINPLEYRVRDLKVRFGAASFCPHFSLYLTTTAERLQSFDSSYGYIWWRQCLLGASSCSCSRMVPNARYAPCQDTPVRFPPSSASEANATLSLNHKHNVCRSGSLGWVLLRQSLPTDYLIPFMSPRLVLQ